MVLGNLAAHEEELLAAVGMHPGQQQGSQRVANVVMLGVYLAVSQAVQKASLIAAIEDVLGPGKRHLLEINLRALDAGIAFATKVQV